MATSTLPEDVIVDILSRLPVKSLVRFKCVQKSWRDLIESSSFAAKHLGLAVARSDNPSLLVKSMQLETGRNLVSLHPRGLPNNFTEMQLPRFYENSRYFAVLPVCVNGIVCLYEPDKGIVLWNPVLRESKIVPVPPVRVSPKLDPYISGFGFGYDAKSDDYKVVLITDFWESEGLPPPPLVYSLRKDCWRTVETDMNGYIHFTLFSEIFVNGACHWWAIDGGYDDEDHEVILAFDISEEVFRKLPLPDCPTEHVNGKCLAVLNDSIAFILYPLTELEKSFDIWVMNKYGFKESWTKEYTIRQTIGVHQPLGIWNNEKLLLETVRGNLITCDLVTQSIETIHIDGVPNTTKVLNYVESLVPVKRDN